MRVTILGSGGSGGVPLLGGHWGRCNPANPRNRRRRVSVLVEQAGTILLIDSSPDARAQLLDAGVKRLDAVLYTHDHADHSHGIDELRYLRRHLDSPPLPAYGTSATLASLTSRFAYVFEPVSNHKAYPAFLEARQVEGPFELNGIPVVPFEQGHGRGALTTGYRLGGMAYSTDVVELPEAAFAVLQGLELWIVDCLRFEAHPTHAHFDKALAWIERVKPKHAILTHLNHSVDYDEIARRCPPGVEPAYDGLSVALDDTVAI